MFVGIHNSMNETESHPLSDKFGLVYGWTSWKSSKAVDA